jgi:hypothetical protein
MKKILVVIAITAVFTSIKADTYYYYGGDRLDLGKFQAYYKEKYFEYDYQYPNQNGTVTGQTDMLSGLSQNFGLRYASNPNTVLNFNLLYIVQELQSPSATTDYNNPHLFSILVENFNYDGPGVIYGLRLPIQNKVIDNGRFIYDNDKFNAVLGILKQDYVKWFFYSYQAVAEQCLEFKSGYNGEVDLSAAIGANFHNEEEKQKIDFIVESDYHAYDYNGVISNVLTIAPQFDVKFFDDFAFVIGVEQILYADNIVLNKNNVLLYLLKLNYIINSDKRAAAAKARDED